MQIEGDKFSENHRKVVKCGQAGQELTLAAREFGQGFLEIPGNGEWVLRFARRFDIEFPGQTDRHGRALYFFKGKPPGCLE